jgi:recombination protein RecA
MDIETISTGSLGLDIALGVGGLPRGRVGRDLRAGILGQDHAGAARRRRGAEEGRHLRLHRRRARARPGLCRKLGVNIDDLLISQPDTGEQALEIADTLVRSGAVDVLVIDSVAALVPEGRDRGRDGRQHAGLQARLMSQALRKLTGLDQQAPTPW